MRLSKKLIETVFPAKNQQRDYVSIELDGLELQERVASAVDLSVSDLDTLKSIKEKLSNNSSYICNVYNKSVKVNLYNNRVLVEVLIKLTGSRNYLVTLAHGFPTEVLNRYYSNEINFPKATEERDWRTILSVFTTVEEAVEAYPEIKSKFETFFGKKF